MAELNITEFEKRCYTCSKTKTRQYYINQEWICDKGICNKCFLYKYGYDLDESYPCAIVESSNEFCIEEAMPLLIDENEYFLIGTDLINNVISIAYSIKIPSKFTNGDSVYFVFDDLELIYYIEDKHDLMVSIDGDTKYYKSGCYLDDEGFLVIFKVYDEYIHKGG